MTATGTAMAINERAASEALSAWEAYRTKAEPLGLSFGQKLYVLREELSAQGVDGQGLCAWLDKVSIPRSTAYYWIHRYEESIGEREVKPKTKWVRALNAPEPTPVPRPTSEPATAPSAFLENTYKTPAQVPAPTEPTVLLQNTVHEKSWNTIADGRFWEDLYRELNSLVPSISDGSPHKMPSMLQEALNHSATTELTEAERNYRLYVIDLLNQISKNFATYAKRLAEVV